jgi:hypothetical protein
LELSSPDVRLTAELVVSILTSLKQLTSLALNYEIFQAEFDALLENAPQLISFTCKRLNLEEDRSASPCSWKELVMKRQGLDVETLARIPTGSLTCLAFNNVVFPSPAPTLKFVPYGLSDPDNVPEMVCCSLVNLMRCPAWRQCGPKVHVFFQGNGKPVDTETPDLSSLICALAPLAGKEVGLSVYMPEATVGAFEVQQLGAVLGSSLKQLMLRDCQLLEDFWTAVWAHLPGLQQLRVGDNVRGAIGVDVLAVFCSRATRPLQLNLGQALYQEVGGRLKWQCRLWGVPQVTVAAVKF